MRDDAFRAFLAPRLSPRAASSYLSNLRRVERVLHADLDALDLGEPALSVLRSRLGQAGLSAAKVGDCMSALRRYAAFSAGTALRAVAAIPEPGCNG